MLRIAVTGSNGKTSTCRWIDAAISAAGLLVARSDSSGRALAGKPIVTDVSYAGFLEFQRRAETAGAFALIVEVTSMALSNGFANRWPCDVAVWTNITAEHLDDHGTMGKYLRIKSRLFDALTPGGIAVVNGTDPGIARIVSTAEDEVSLRAYGLESRPAQVPLTVTGMVREMDWHATHLSLSMPASTECHDLTVPAPGEHFAENAIAAWTVATAVGVSPGVAAHGIRQSSLPDGRFDVIASDPTVVVDYGHSPDAQQRTVTTMRKLTAGKLILVFGAHGLMDRAKRLRMGAATEGADMIILTSHSPCDQDPVEIAREVAEGIPTGTPVSVHIVPDRREAIALALATAGPRDSILIAGRGTEREQRVRDQLIPLVDRDVALDLLEVRGSRR